MRPDAAMNRRMRVPRSDDTCNVHGGEPPPLRFHSGPNRECVPGRETVRPISNLRQKLSWEGAIVRRRPYPD
jgi:hypothetical protein